MHKEMPVREITCLCCGAAAERKAQSRSNFCVSCISIQRKECERAGNAVQKAIRAGDIPHPLTCACADCGKPASVYDHRDYTRPLDVEPVCRSCNYKRGQAFNSVYRPALSN
jgi:hypothetical protein